MPVNKYFSSHSTKSEQGLLQDLISEVIEIHGINAIYIPRNQNSPNLLFGEDPTAKFDRWFEMAMYVKDGQGFDGQTIQQMWGISMPQSVVLQVSKTEFATQVGQELNPNRPKEGDIINLPYGMPGQYMLEIKKVIDSNAPFIQLGNEYIYEFNCRIFTYGQEAIKTGLPQIDAVEDIAKQSIELQLGIGSGTFLMGEVVFQGASFGASTFKAIVKSLNGNILSLKNMNGNLAPGLMLNGNTSGAIYAISSGDQQSVDNDPIAQNSLIQTTANPIFITDPRNPFDKGKI